MAIDAYLKIDTVEGESEDDKHGGEIEVMSFSWGVHNSGSAGQGGGSGAGKANHGDFSFTCQTGKSSPKLMGAAASGQHIASAVLTLRKAGGGENPGQDYFTMTFTDILISSYQFGGSSGGDNPMDSISFNYAKMEFSYAPQTKTGSLGAAIKKSVDVKLNKVT